MPRPNEDNTFSDKVFDIVASIPPGFVTTYGTIARMIGKPRSARYVGFALRNNTDPKTYPCHRVVFKDGSLSKGYIFGGEGVQRELLVQEGVLFTDATHVDMERCAWPPDITFDF